MLKACAYCGRVHAMNEVCSKKPEVKRTWTTRTREQKFRSTIAWQRKRKQILERDYHCCKMCLPYLNSYNLEVHHIVKLVDDWDSRLDDNNLITLCQAHHREAEEGQIKPDLLREKIKISPRDSF